MAGAVFWFSGFSGRERAQIPEDLTLIIFLQWWGGNAFYPLFSKFHFTAWSTVGHPRPHQWPKTRPRQKVESCANPILWLSGFCCSFFYPKSNINSLNQSQFPSLYQDSQCLFQACLGLKWSSSFGQELRWYSWPLRWYCLRGFPTQQDSKQWHSWENAGKV